MMMHAMKTYWRMEVTLHTFLILHSPHFPNNFILTVIQQEEINTYSWWYNTISLYVSLKNSEHLNKISDNINMHLKKKYRDEVHNMQS